MTDGRVVIVGGGVLGTLHAVEARSRGWHVEHLEMDPEPQQATVRNFGMLWIGGRATGLELELALDARRRWQALDEVAPAIGFRSDGSITLATHQVHMDAFAELVARDDSATRGFHLLDVAQVRERNPALRGEFLGGLWCSLDAVLEPRLTLGALRDTVLAGPHYRFHGGRQTLEVDSGRVTDDAGRVHTGDLVIVCPGSRASAIATTLAPRAPLRRVRLQMLQTAPHPRRLTTAVADGGSLPRHPGYDVPALERLPPSAPVEDEFDAQLICAQRASGALTVGDTHEYDEPFAFDLSERPYRHLLDRLEQLLGEPAGPVQRRWSGVYHRCTDDRLWWREAIGEGVVVVTGAGSRGMTLAPAIAAETFDSLIDGVDSGATIPSREQRRN